MNFHVLLLFPLISSRLVVVCDQLGDLADGDRLALSMK